MAPLLEVKNLVTQFFTMEGVVKAVDGISYDLEPGETLGLVGESGCGKSVSALSVMRLIPWPPGRVMSGEVIFEGEDLLKIDNDEMRSIRGKEIAMVFQEPMTSLNPVLTIGRQLTETMELHLNLDKQGAQQRAVDLLQMVGIPDSERRLAQYPHQFSGWLGLGCVPTPEGDDCHGAELQSQASDCRRAYYRAGRNHSGPDLGANEEPLS